MQFIVIHLSPDGTTNYLSEVETGSEVLILNSKGKARRATVGRSKIERRPMLMIKGISRMEKLEELLHKMQKQLDL